MNKAEARKILGVEASATPEEIKKAYRKQAMKHHPDREGGDEAKFKQLEEAMKTLEKEDYSEHTFGRSTSSNYHRDILEEILRQSMGGWAKNHGAESFGAARERILDATIKVTLEEAFNGCSQTVNMGIPGAAAMRIEVPAGSDEKTIIKTIHVGTDIYRVRIHIDTDVTIDWGENSKADRGNIRSNLNVSAIKMMLGGWEEVKTLDGSIVTVRIPAGLASNMTLKVKGKGYWRDTDRNHERGDLLLKVVPRIQKIEDVSDDERKQLLEALNAKETPDV